MYTQPTALRSVLDHNYLQYCLSEQYDIGQWSECLFWLRGLNDTYRVRTSKGYYILRVYRHEIKEQDVSYELSLLNQLKVLLGSEHTSVAEPIAKKDNHFYTVIEAAEGKRVAVLFRFIQGKENGLHDEKSCYAFGQSAAQLHEAMDQVNLEQPRYVLDCDFLIDQPLERIVNYIGDNHEAASFLQPFAQALKDRIVDAANQGLDFGICHGDMHGNNNAMEQSGHFTHLDFEWSAKGWRAYDLAQVRARKRQQEETKEQLWHALMAGYRSIRTFSEQDEKAIELFVIARRFWVMSLDVAFIPSDNGAIDYSENWLDGFIAEFRKTNIV
ncbi:phosphotransferase [Paenibacillus sp. PL91]|uniref:phosphotransferase n=1 Tax=Paenibacillus sp. PL91 TaxID=2729538 RepID=UPI00145F6AE6|nr:phosphotransferase [Paenibacillus sp. PL91]MBC9198353.1 phosphotransferase [Paenibacillus sp. PL91]